MRIRSRVVVVSMAIVVASSSAALAAFGTAGKRAVNVGGVNSADDVVRGPQGRIVSAGSTTMAGDFDVAAVVLDSSGTPDSSFSGDGIQVTDLGGFDVADAVDVTGDGGVLVAGSTDAGLDPEPGRQGALIRYTATGGLDGGFSGDGKEIYSFGGKTSSFGDVVVQPDGKAVVAGAIEGGKLLVARFKKTGELDPSFGKNGKVTMKFKASTGADSLALTKGGRITVGGQTSGGGMGAPDSMIFLRLTKSGKLDKTFSEDGKATIKWKGSAGVDSLVANRDGSFYAMGGLSDNSSFKAAIVALSKNGKPVKGFGKKGRVVKDFGDEDGFGALALQGKKVVLGGRIQNASIDFLVARFTKKGKLDASFSGDGFTSTDFAGGDVVTSMMVDAQGKLVAAGLGANAFAFARYEKNGELDD